MQSLYAFQIFLAASSCKSLGHALRALLSVQALSIYPSNQTLSTACPPVSYKFTGSLKVRLRELGTYLKEQVFVSISVLFLFWENKYFLSKPLFFNFDFNYRSYLVQWHEEMRNHFMKCMKNVSTKYKGLKLFL